MTGESSGSTVMRVEIESALTGSDYLPQAFLYAAW
jgi:hypothetical protein